MKERHGAPGTTRSNCDSFLLDASKPRLPEGLIGPVSEVPVQIEGVYAKALLDSGSQVTLLYRSFYDTYLKHLELQPVENLEIWGLSSHKYPYDGYLPLRLEFTESVAGVHQIIDTLAIVCPDPVKREGIAILLGTNTSLVKKLLESCRKQAGEEFLNVLTIHPVIREAFETIQLTDFSQDDSDTHGTVWFIKHNPVVLKPNQVRQLSGLLKFPGQSTESLVLVDRVADCDTRSEHLDVRPELHAASVVSSRQVTVTVRNMSNREIWVKRGTPLAHVLPVSLVPQLTAKQPPVQNPLSPASFDFGDSPMPEEAKQSLREKMMQRKDVFSLHEWDVGCSKSTTHEIRLNDLRPFRERSRRLAPADLEDVRLHLQELQSSGIISESRSPYASPIVVVRKKSGKVRMCVDYRTLNQRTTPDQYTVPRIEDALHSLSGSKWFSVLDLRSGYYQIPMSDADKEKTAFICPLGFYQFERMPQGICGAPATFQRVMERTVGDMNFLEVLVYLDDLIVFGRTIDEHEERLLKVLDRLSDEGLKISLDKCQFGRTSVNYVGHIVSQDGISTDPSKIEAVVSWPKPQTVTELRSFLGFCGYYRRFVKDFSKLCRPLNELLKGYPSTRKNRDSPVCNTKPCYKSSEPFGSRWSAQCDTAFETLKKCLTQAPVLAFADVQKPYVLHVDASMDGLGGVLCQEHESGLRPVAFISRSLSPSERNYPAHKLEFLALKWAVVDRLHDYLYGVPFEVRTDNNPLTYITKSAKLDATGHRWLSALTTYNFSLKYRPGRRNVDADALSRRPHTHRSEDDEWQEIPAVGVRTFCQAVSLEKRAENGFYTCVVKQAGAHMSAVPKAYSHVMEVAADHLPLFSSSDLQTAQRNDSLLGEVWKAVCDKKPASSIRSSHPSMKILKREWEKLVVNNGMLYRIVRQSNHKVKQQLVLPKQFHSSVLKSLHDDIGHLGFEKSYGLVRDRFYWPHMKPDVESYCKTCERCIKRKTLPQRAAPLSHMQSSGPLDLVCIDFLSIEADSRNVCNVLVVTDHYTRYAQAFPTRDQKASTVAKTLWEKYFIHYGLPTRIHSDQGRDFESQLVSEMLTMLGIKKSRTSPYHPQGDPQPERFNRTLLNMLGTLEPSQKSKWSQHIARLVHAYNCTVNEATGFSPYFLMFGREARLPVDVCFGVSADSSSSGSYSKYVSKMKQELQAAYQLAQVSSEKMNQSNKARYDQKVRYHSLSVGDRVLIRNLGLKGKQKLADRWSENPYVVESQLSGIPVYRLKPVDGNGPVKVMHRNHLLPLGQEVRLTPKVDLGPTSLPKNLRHRSVKEKLKTAQSENPPIAVDVFSREHDSSDSDSEYGCYVEDMAPISSESAQEIQGETPEQAVECLDYSNAHRVSEIPVIPCQSETSEFQLTDADRNTDVVDDVMTEVSESTSQTTVQTTDNETQPEIVPFEVRRSNRERKPSTRFTYDKLGVPYLHSVSSKCCGFNALTTEVLNVYGSLNKSHAWWCNPNALCTTCKNRPVLVPYKQMVAM